MSYPIYHTPAFVLRSVNRGESNKVVSLYTRDLGLIHAHAQGVRVIHSKLRYHLQEFTYVQVSLVKGREQWRITGAEQGEVLPDMFFWKRISSLLLNLIRGEEVHPRLFSVLEGSLQYLKREPSSRDILEIVTVIKILYHLGYLAPTEMSKKFVEEDAIDATTLSEAEALRQVLITHINTSFEHARL